MKILGIEHVAIATDDLDGDAPFWKHVLNISHSSTEDVLSESVTTDIYNTGRGKIELLSEVGDDTHISRFLEKRGKGIHHICLEVDDIDNAIDELKEKGIRLIKDEPTVGAEGYRIIFIHPESAGGVLVELAERSF
ncbi:MAG: methylmalonyl-CoA epimerase [Candidatus Neomarinimicrobiota bacterium]|nr:methylmalonyl-CoA epimerase [Candidatus Neomarinimicrobiota bacterium]